MHHITPTAYEIQPSDKFQFGAMDSAVRPSTIIFINKVIRKVGKYFYTKYNIKSPDLWWWLQEVRVLHLCAYCRISLADLSGKKIRRNLFKNPLPTFFSLSSWCQCFKKCLALYASWLSKYILNGNFKRIPFSDCFTLIWKRLVSVNILLHKLIWLLKAMHIIKTNRIQNG